MGLYFGQVIIWFLGVTKANLRRPAMYCLVVFMLGLAGGRILSLIVDGMSHWLLVVILDFGINNRLCLDWCSLRKKKGE
jgi:hypothetical protein